MSAASEPAAGAAQAAPGAAPPARWIVARPVDLAMMSAPFLVALFILATYGGAPPRKDEEEGLLAFLLLIVAFDVAHVWSTIYISYLDGEALARRRLLFLLPIPLTVLVAFRLHLYSPPLFWTLMAYVAVHHFAAQQYGFVALYKLRAGERAPFDRYLDKWTLWVGALGPVLWFHTLQPSSGWWFGHSEVPVLLLPIHDPELSGGWTHAELQHDILALMAAFAVVYLARQGQLACRGALNWGKNLFMLGSWASWSLGIYYAGHPLVSLALINLFHGIPFLVLVWYRLNRHWSQRGEPGPGTRLVRWLARPRNLWAFYGLVLTLALLEELAWEGFVWGRYVPRVEALTHGEVSLIVALLATPQIVHYYLDAWLWKLDGTNPDLNLALGLKPRGP